MLCPPLKPATLRNPSTGDKIALTVVGYQFAKPMEDRYDSNWLMVWLEAHVGGCSWKTTDPCMLTWDLREFIEWLRAFARDVVSLDCFCFLEPAIAFEAKLAPSRTLDVVLSHEWSPPGADPFEEVTVRFTPKDSELIAFADSLEAQLAAFPER